jgi:hypothetical protein
MDQHEDRSSMVVHRSPCWLTAGGEPAWTAWTRWASMDRLSAQGTGSISGLWARIGELRSYEPDAPASEGTAAAEMHARARRARMRIVPAPTNLGQ